MIPTGDIAAVVFMTELLTRLRNKGVDLDKVSHCRARQDGKLLDKTNNTKYAARQIADIIHSWVPTRTTDPDTQHELTQPRSQLAQLRQRIGEDTGDTSASPTTGPSASSPATTPIQRSLLNNSNNPSPPPPPIQPVGLPFHCQSMAGSADATHSSSMSFRQMAQRTSTVRAQKKGSHRQHRQDGRVVVTSTVRRHRNRGKSGRHDGHSRQPSGQELGL